MPTQRPCLPLPCPGSKMLAGSTIFFIDDIVQQLIHAVWQDYWSLVRCFIRVSSSVKLRNADVHRFQLSTCVFCQNFIHSHFHNLELLVRHHFCGCIRASVQTCAFAWFRKHCDIFFYLLAGEFFPQTAWLTAEHQPGRLREELTSHQIKKYVAMFLKPGKSTGLDRRPNTPTKMMTDEEFQIVKV